MRKPEDDCCEFCGEDLLDCNCWVDDDYYSSEDWDIDDDWYDDEDEDWEDDYDDDWDYYDDEDEDDWG